VMTATLDDVTKRIKKEPTPEEMLAADLVARAREHGVALTGPDGLLKQLTKTVIETALNQGLTEHLGHAKHEPAGKKAGNVRNGTRPKTVLTESTGQVGIEVPRDRDGTFEPRIVKKRQRRLPGWIRSCCRSTRKGSRPGRSPRTSMRSTARACPRRPARAKAPCRSSRSVL
jgi:putative transposase